MMSDKELTAMQKVLEALAEVEDEAAQGRVINWVVERLGLDQSRRKIDHETPGNKGFETFADLFNATSAKTNPDIALVASYWLQVCSGKDQFTSQSVNKELQDLGRSLVNVTMAFTQLKKRKPALAIQVKKSGKSKQARKLYKLTKAGIDTVNTMIQGPVNG